MADWNEWIGELLSKVNIVDIISRYVPLTRKGNTYWGSCPFHHESDPSFSVTEDKQFYHCFGCKESGNAITFLSKIESIERIDAIKMLADEVKMELPNSNYNADFSKTVAKKERLSQLMKESALYYHKNLSLPQAEKARRYLTSREITNDMIIRFGLGYSLGFREIIPFLESKGYTKTEMREAGIVEAKVDYFYDVFGERLIFPIINNFGEVVSFGGRTLEKDPKFAKYRNGSQTLLFDKSKNIYGINLLKKKKQKENINFIVMVEGYMDVISLHKAGFDMAVASMGTALTSSQAKQLKNFAKNIYICYDGDTAGQKATIRGLDILQDAGLNVKVISLPEGLDPDDVIRKFGKEKYASLIDSAMTLTAFKLDTVRKSCDLSTPDGKSLYAVECAKVISQLENPVEKEEYLETVRLNSNYNMSTLRQQVELNAEVIDVPSVVKSDSMEDKPLLDKNIAFILASILHSRNYIKLNDDIYELLTTDLERNLYARVVESKKNNQSIGVFIESVPKELETASLLLVNYEFLDGDNEKTYRDCLYNLQKNSWESEKARLSVSYNDITDVAEKKKILARIGLLQQKLNRMKK